ncbi:anti-sigma factor [Parvibium lacunae]|uniref:Anti-sigma factor n=1 Tax=Parvibium lacunae TaxID=1888893 RepID=A0A368KZM5_9BURK|nr:anti-sigma factor [Parvibium lacunae]
MKLGYSCRQAARLLCEKQDRALGLGERLALRIHLGLCGNCRNFDRQLGLMRAAVRMQRQRD